jgi:hypothetical protein
VRKLKWHWQGTGAVLLHRASWCALCINISASAQQQICSFSAATADGHMQCSTACRPWCTSVSLIGQQQPHGGQVEVLGSYLKAEYVAGTRCL